MQDNSCAKSEIMVQFRCVPAAALLSLLSAVFPFAGCSPPQERVYEPERLNVRLFRAGERMPEGISHYYRGRIEAGHEAHLGFEAGGYVAEATAVVGTFVRKGELLAQLDPEQLRRIWEGLRAAESLSRTAYERLDTVFGRGSVAEMKIIEARAQFEQARSAVRSAEVQLRKTAIVAPFDAYVTKMLIEKGSTARPLAPIISLADISVLKAVIRLSEFEISYFNRGDSVEILVPAVEGQRSIGIVAEAAVDTDNDPASYWVKIRFKNTERSILPGMACNVRTLSKRRKSLSHADGKILIPSDAVRNDGDSSFVYIYDPNSSQARRRMVTVGVIVGYGTEITSGLDEGEPVIVGAGSGLADGTKVEIIK